MKNKYTAVPRHTEMRDNLASKLNKMMNRLQKER